MASHDLEITEVALDKLATLKAVPKFVEDEESLYPGAPDEDIRLHCEKAIDTLLERLIAGLPRNPSRAYVLSEFLAGLNDFEDEDTEERERACGYCEEIMDILSIEDSEGTLNNWLYGLDPK